MPEHYALPEPMRDAVFSKSLSEKIIHSDEERRSSKTFIPTLRLIFCLSVVENHAKRLADDLAKIRNTRLRDKKLVMTAREAMDVMTSARTWKNFHGGVLEHSGSFNGFNVRAAVRAEMLREAEQTTQIRQVAPEATAAQNGSNGGGR